MLTFNDILKKRDLQPPILYGISNRLAFPQLDPMRYLELFFKTPAHILQWREKDLPAERNRIFIHHGVQLAKECGKLFFVNSLYEVAFDEGADGAHLTSRQDVKEARRARERLTGKQAMVGKSVHSLQEAEIAEKDGVDYLLLGPIFQPLSKAPNIPPLGTSVLHRVVEAVDKPVFAIGGIDEPHFEEIFTTGATGAAGISWVQREVEKLLTPDR
ncbi:thiamine phosphate synthase [Acidobacteria bacterium AH-259-D05]|nr:thiamine phosphate synthase [Acidobacteria bacterium AH-259-D05]